MRTDEGGLGVAVARPPAGPPANRRTIHRPADQRRQAEIPEAPHLDAVNALQTRRITLRVRVDEVTRPPRGRREHPDVLTSRHEPFGDALKNELAPANGRKVIVRDLQDPHRTPRAT